MSLPVFRRANFKILSKGRFVPKYTVLDFITLRCIVQHDALKIFGAGVHHFIEHIEGWKNSEERLVYLLSILNDVFPEDEHVVHVGAKRRWKIHAVLHGEHEKYFPVSSIHETLANTSVF